MVTKYWRGAPRAAPLGGRGPLGDPRKEEVQPIDPAHWVEHANLYAQRREATPTPEKEKEGNVDGDVDLIVFLSSCHAHTGHTCEL